MQRQILIIVGFLIDISSSSVVLTFDFFARRKELVEEKTDTAG